MKKKNLIPTLLAIIFLASAWQFVAFQIGYPAIFPSLFDLIKQVFGLLVSENFMLSVSTTVLRGILGFTFAFTFALLFGAIAAFSGFWKAFFHPIIVITRSIPVISFILIAILWFSPPYLPIFIAFITMFPILFQNILTGLEQTDKKWLEMALVFGKTPYKRFISINLPAAKEIIYDGISTAMGFGWRAIIIGEVLAQPLQGIGTRMKHAQAFINVSELIAWTVIAIGVSYLFEILIRSLRNICFTKILPKPASCFFPENKQNTVIKNIEVHDVDKRFNDKSIFLSFSTFFDNRIVNCIKGPSGKGKTTLLRMLAQLEKPDAGTIFLPPGAQLSYSFQDIRLLPWLTVYENIAYVTSKHAPKQDICNLVFLLLEKMELSEHRHKFPHELSGGEQQRVGLARALAARSDILLLDEPLTGLDAALKKRITHFLSLWISTYRPIVVWATHEQVQLNELEVREVSL